VPVEPVSSETRVVLTRPAVEASHEGARRLGTAYWQEVRAFSRGLVRPRVGVDGVELVAAGVGVLLRFGPPETAVEDGVVECRYPIRGGVLAAAPGGWLVLAQSEGEQVELRLAVEGFHPRLARRGRLARARAGLYDALQAPLHADVSRRFLDRAARGPL
jgi:hypothetical protein